MTTVNINNLQWDLTDHANVYYNAHNDRFAYILGGTIEEVGFLEDCLSVRLPLIDGNN